MKKQILFFFLVSFSLLSFGQDLSKLTPEQLDAYKQYMSTKGDQPLQTSQSSSKKYEFKGRGYNKANSYENDSAKFIKSNNKDQFIDKKNKSTKDRKRPDSEFNKEFQDDEEYYDMEDFEFKKKEIKLEVFGSGFFSKQNLTFEPNLNIPTPNNYILGTSDELIIDISGLYDVNYSLKINPEGVVRIPNVGPVAVAGMKIEMASNTIKTKLSRFYQGISNGQTKVNVSLGNIRSIRVNLVGDVVKPGTYTLPSLATVFNALYACGGPSEIGSMREITVYRNGKSIAKLDLYRFLVDGQLTAEDNVVLQDDDVVKVDTYRNRVYISGAVKRIGIYEGLPSETLQKLIRYAGGFSDNAYSDKITVYRYTGKEKTVLDVPLLSVSTFIINSGDSVVVSPSLARIENRVDLTGEVFRPGTYAYEEGLTVKKLLDKAEGVSEKAYLDVAYITRRKLNSLPEIIGFNLSDVLSGRTDINLMKNDSVSIQNIFDFSEGHEVSISGPIKDPGTFLYVKNMTVKDLIFMAKGFTENAATDTIELVRPIKDKKELLASDHKSTVIKIAIDKDLNFKDSTQNLILHSGDQVIVRNISGFEGVRMVRVEGEVLNPGNYNITSKSETISSVINRAGGFTNYAYPLGAFLIRKETLTEVEKKLYKIMQENTKNLLESSQNRSLDASMLRMSGATTVQGYTQMDSLQRKLSGANVADKLFTSEGVVGINLAEIMKQPGSKYDLKLEVGDIIFIPKELQTVRVLGEVLFPTLVRYEDARKLNYYVDNAGGLAVNANKSKILVLYPNGAAHSTKSYLGFKVYPKVIPGSRIIVPEKPKEIKNKLTPAETVAILTSITTAISLMYSILIK